MARWWMIRAGRGKCLVPEWETKSVATIGWPQVGNLADFTTRDDLLERCKAVYPDEHIGAIRLWAGQLWRFSHDIQVGDHVVTYDWPNKEYVYGTVTSPYDYKRDYVGTHPNVIGVKWSARISKSALSRQANNTLGAVQTLFSIDNCALELEAVLDGQSSGPNIERPNGPVYAIQLNQVQGEFHPPVSFPLASDSDRAPLIIYEVTPQGVCLLGYGHSPGGDFDLRTDDWQIDEYMNPIVPYWLKPDEQKDFLPTGEEGYIHLVSNKWWDFIHERNNWLHEYTEQLREWLDTEEGQQWRQQRENNRRHLMNLQQAVAVRDIRLHEFQEYLRGTLVYQLFSVEPEVYQANTEEVIVDRFSKALRASSQRVPNWQEIAHTLSGLKYLSLSYTTEFISVLAPSVAYTHVSGLTKWLERLRIVPTIPQTFKTYWGTLPFVLSARTVLDLSGDEFDLICMFERTHASSGLGVVTEVEAINGSPQPAVSNVEDTPNKTVMFTLDFDVIRSRIHATGLIYDDHVIAAFHAGMHALSHKHFVILSGISGTGKTKLAQAYANAVYGLELHQENPYLLIVAVQPQWNDTTSLIGYLSPVTKQYYRTAFLDFLLRASADEQTGTPYFVCLDEMNLAMVEHYFSDFLSAWESGAPMDLHTGDESVTGVPRQLKIPRNLYVIGTVNVDESTHAFSKKVLDRAFVLELADVDYDGYIEKRVDNPRVHKLVSIVKFIGQKMKPFHLHVGYRVLDEMAAYMENYPVSVDNRRLIDGLILQKVLPRIGGDERILPALLEIRQYFTEELGPEAAAVLRLDEMIGELESTGMCQFWR